MEQVENCRIESVYFGLEDHNILTFYIGCTNDSWTQSFGGYSLDNSIKLPEILRKLLETFEVREWNQLKGLNIRVIKDHFMIIAIGHIYKNKWFHRDIFKEVYKKEIK